MERSSTGACRDRAHHGSLCCSLRSDWSADTVLDRITHFTEELPFLSEEDKDWIMGRARQEADDRHADGDDPLRRSAIHRHH